MKMEYDLLSFSTAVTGPPSPTIILIFLLLITIAAGFLWFHRNGDEERISCRSSMGECPQLKYLQGSGRGKMGQRETVNTGEVSTEATGSCGAEIILSGCPTWRQGAGPLYPCICLWRAGCLCRGGMTLSEVIFGERLSCEPSQYTFLGARWVGVTWSWRGNTGDCNDRHLHLHHCLGLEMAFRTALVAQSFHFSSVTHEEGKGKAAPKGSTELELDLQSTLGRHGTVARPQTWQE